MKDKFIALANLYYEDMKHPLSVAYSFEELSDQWIVGLFHDILEDTAIERDILFYFLSIHGKYDLFKEIESLTRKKGELYFDYIRRLDGISKEVKIADLKHNLSRVDTLKDSLKKRYLKALTIVTKG